MTRPALTREYLDFQSDRIERVLASHRVPVRVRGGTVTPRWVRFNLAPTLGARIASIRNLSEELALALGAADVRLTREGESLALDVPRADAQPVRLLPLMRNLPTLPPFTACLGLAEDGRPLLVRLSSPDVAHILVAGTTGSGKTELMRTILVSLALTHHPSELRIVLIDPKGRGFAPLAGFRHCLGPIATRPTDALNVLERLVAEMERRDHDSGSGRVRQPRILIAVDELPDLLTTSGKGVEAALVRIAQRGREAGLHLLAGAQRPASSTVGPLLKANFPLRLVGRVASAEDARVAAGIAATGAEKLMGRGDFLAVHAGQATGPLAPVRAQARGAQGQGVTRFQAAWIPAGDWAALT
jgi:S-DNA-T family DNA segregation ATPase FtsK/SpoIIIE